MTVLGTTGSMLAATEMSGLFYAQMGGVLALGLAAVGSAIGIGMAGQAAAGAWAKEARAGKNLSFRYIILLGLPMSQTLYALVAMLAMYRVIDENPEAALANAGLLFGIGLGLGLGEMMSAWLQGMTGAAGIRGLSESEGKGFAFLLIAMGIVETVGIFAFVFMQLRITAIA